MAVKKKNKGGRPTEFKPKVINSLIKHRRLGYSNEAAAAVSGITGRTLQVWLAAAIEYEDIKKPTKIQQEFIQFLHNYKNARELFLQSRYNNITKAGETTWQADAWQLERAKPDEYGRRDRLTIEVDQQAILKKVAEGSDYTPEEIEAAMAARKK
jgi:hypothetical protein